MAIKYPAKNRFLKRWLISQLKLVPFIHLFKNLSYSQRFEDILICQLLGDEIGSYIDVGSGLPCFGSNTYRLYKRGWSGILIDPVPRNIRLSKIFRPKDICLNYGVGETEGVSDFYHFDPYELSTFDKTVADRRMTENFVKLRGVVPIQISTLSKLLKSYDLVAPLVLSVDTEGFDLQVLKGYAWNRLKPEIICIEELENPINRNTEIKNYLNERNYELIYYAGLSSIYKLKNSEPIT